MSRGLGGTYGGTAPFRRVFAGVSCPMPSPSRLVGPSLLGWPPACSRTLWWIFHRLRPATSLSGAPVTSGLRLLVRPCLARRPLAMAAHFGLAVCGQPERAGQLFRPTLMVLLASLPSGAYRLPFRTIMLRRSGASSSGFSILIRRSTRRPSIQIPRLLLMALEICLGSARLSNLMPPSGGPSLRLSMTLPGCLSR
jgi:hypothetical protein